MTPKLHEALTFATQAHGTQTRKYDGSPYIVHPIEVMMIVLRHVQSPSEDMLAAALLHDVVEDTEVTLEDIEAKFGAFTANLVDVLTDRYTHEAYPEKNRRWRKEQEAIRLGNAPARAQTIKYADMISNSRTISREDPKFWEVYKAEKRELLFHMTQGDAGLRQMAYDMLEF